MNPTNTTLVRRYLSTEYLQHEMFLILPPVSSRCQPSQLNGRYHQSNCSSFRSRREVPAYIKFTGFPHMSHPLLLLLISLGLFPPHEHSISFPVTQYVGLIRHCSRTARFGHDWPNSCLCHFPHPVARINVFSLQSPPLDQTESGIR